MAFCSVLRDKFSREQLQRLRYAVGIQALSGESIGQRRRFSELKCLLPIESPLQAQQVTAIPRTAYGRRLKQMDKSFDAERVGGASMPECLHELIGQEFPVEAKKHLDFVLDGV